jgi:hypothetical protein
MPRINNDLQVARRRDCLDLAAFQHYCPQLTWMKKGHSHNNGWHQRLVRVHSTRQCYFRSLALDSQAHRPGARSDGNGHVG